MANVEMLIQVDFDRRDYGALEATPLPCLNSNIMTHAVDDQKRIWWWSNDDEIWYLLDDENTQLAWASIDDWLQVAQRFIKILPLYARPGYHGERQAAFEALLRVLGPHYDRYYSLGNSCENVWGHEAAGFYRQCTIHYSWLLDAVSEHDPAVEAALSEDGELWFTLNRDDGS